MSEVRQVLLGGSNPLEHISVETLCTYIPVNVVTMLMEKIKRGESALVQLPFTHPLDTVVLFADISGFTALCESLVKRDGDYLGAENLAKHLNSYYEQLVRIIGSQGGDVLKFAGDALLVLWPPEEESNLETLTRRAAQAALEIQKKLHMAKLEEGVVLSVKLGIGVGKVAMVHVGGVLNRIEYLAVGDPLAQAFHAEHSAVAGQIVLSAKAWDLVKEWFVAESISDDGHVFLDAENGAKKDLRKVGIGAQFAHLGLSGDISVAKSVRNYVPGAVLPYLKENREERWASEIRRVAVVFINLGLSERELAEINSSDNNEELSRLQEVIYAVQTCVYRYEGSLNKFLMDDKGSTVVAVFGLPPLAHEDDSVRAVLSSLMIMKKLNELNLFPSIGVTTGAAFCGVVGGRVRREYTVLGDTVNLAARLMQYSMSHAKGIYCDSATSYLAQGYLPFDEVDTVKLKGKDKAVKILRPKIIPGWISPKVLVHSFMLSQRLDPIKKVSINGYSGKSSLAFGAMRFEDLEKFKIKKDDTLKQKPRASKFIFKNSPFLEVLQDASEGEYAAIKNFHINLPYNLGTLSISSKGIKNLYQIKDKAFEFMRKRTLLEIGMRREHFIFRLPDTSIHVRNEGINLDFLAELLSPYVVTLLFIELDLIKRSEATLRPDLQEFNPLFLHQIGADKAQEDFLSVIHSTLSRCKGITLLLEGEMGLGKTRLIETLCIEAGSIVLVTNASPFERVYSASSLSQGSDDPTKHFGILSVWRKFIFKLLDLEIESDIVHGKKGQRTSDIAEVGIEIMNSERQNILGLIFKNSDKFEYLSLLNEPFGLKFNSFSRVTALGDSERLELLFEMILNVLKFFLKKTSLILVIDDALFLDSYSWTLVMRITKELCGFGQGLLLVLSTRPMNKLYLGTFSIEIPLEYIELLSSPSENFSSKIVLQPLPDNTILKIACEKLGVSSLAPLVSQMLVQRAQGNPLVIQELIYELKKKALVYNDLGVCKLSDNFTDLSNVPVPISIQNSLGCRLDRMSHSQLMLLKTACLVGKEFTYGVLSETVPVQGESRSLAEDLSILCDLNVLSIVNDHFTEFVTYFEEKEDLQSNDSSLSSNSKFHSTTVLTFANPFMCDVVYSHLLESQRNYLMQKVNDYKEKVFFSKPVRIKDLEEGSIEWSGILFIRKDIERLSAFKRQIMAKAEWKKRYVVIKKKALFFYYDEVNPTLLGVIPLSGVDVGSFPEIEIGREFVLTLDCPIWIKKGEESRVKRSFYFAASSLEEERQLIFILNNLISQQLSVLEKRILVRRLRSHRRSNSSSSFSSSYSNRSDKEEHLGETSKSLKESDEKSSLRALYHSPKVLDIRKTLARDDTEIKSSSRMPPILENDQRALKSSTFSSFSSADGFTQGFLNIKSTKNSTGWTKVWAAFAHDSLEIFQEAPACDENFLFEISLIKATVSRNERKANQFEIYVSFVFNGSELQEGKLVYEFECDSPDICKSWMTSIENQIVLAECLP